MPSSTFNSNPAHRVPPLKWRAIWLEAIAIAVVALAVTESLLRAHGHSPSVVDGPLFWSFHRGKITGQSVVLLGASRMQIGFSMDVFHRRFPSRPVHMLAIGGKEPVAALRDLANDRDFRGLVICSVLAPYLSSGGWDRQQDYVDRYRTVDSNEFCEPLIRAWVQDRLSLVNPNVSLINVIAKIMRHGRFPLPHHVKMRFDRSRLADYSAVDLEKHRLARTNAARRQQRVPLSLWLKDAGVIGSFVRRIRERGGKVVFVRFPTTGEAWEAQERIHPKQVYWDQLENVTGAMAIHFRDVPSLVEFDCPDTSHLDYRDKSKFTELLLDELVERGALPKD